MGFRSHRFATGIVPGITRFCAVMTCAALLAAPAAAAPYAAMVMDSRTGKVLHSRNADSRLHPASLTKMMTLYVTFEAVERNEIDLDTKVRISHKAANEKPSRLGLRPGQEIALRHLIRATAVKSANDASTAIAEAISGSEAAFIRRMNRTAKAIGMSKTTFKNAHGLTERGHLSTARDMTNLGRQLLFDYPDYYNLFSRGSTHAGVKTVRNSNRDFLNDYSGADGIKTGYTRAAGFNLVASAKRRNERIIVTVFGGRSPATRNAKVAELMDLGFNRSPSKANIVRPSPPSYQTNFIRGLVTTSRLPVPRPASKTLPEPAVGERPSANIRTAAASSSIPRALERSIADALREAIATGTGERSPDGRTSPPPTVSDTSEGPVSKTPVPKPRPESLVPRPPPPAKRPTVVARASSSNEGRYGVRLGLFPSRDSAERILLQTTLTEVETLDSANREVNKRAGGYEASFVGMTEDRATRACRRLSAQNLQCEIVYP